jgi:hypothetical protein
VLLARVAPLPAEEAVRARMAHVQGQVELAAGVPATACTLLIEGAERIMGSDPNRATEMLVLAARAALAANQLNRVVDDIGPAIFRLPGHDTRVQRIAQSLTAAGLGQVAPTATDSKRLSALATPGHPTAHAPIALLATGELVEAAVRAEVLDGIEPMVARFERWAERDKRTWTLVTAARCRALISQGDEAERHFQAALATDGLGERPFQLARTELAYGEWLRRASRRADARPRLPPGG